MSFIRAEQEIIATWKTDLKNPAVSICCLTYNHEKYIEDTIKGFLIQETNFPFEVIIYDDASTDGCTDIIRKYQSKYPRIIKAVYAPDNQYSKGDKAMFGAFLFPLVKGRYIAICEGDDYWVVSNKIQKQFNFLESNTIYSACAHKVDVMFEGVPEKDNFYPEPLIDPELDEFLNTKRYIALLSIFARASILKNIPEWGGALAGEHILILSYLRMKGRFYFFNDFAMGVHRKNPGGITYNPESRYSDKKMAGALVFVGKDRFKINRLRVMMYENLFLHGNYEQKSVIGKILKKLYKRAIYKEVFNFNLKRACLYFFKLSVLKDNLKEIY